MKFPTLRKSVCGIALPVSALMTKKSCGIGEFSDLILFADFCKKTGMRIIQLLPVNDTGTDSSPYNALSAFALHPVYIRLEELPEAVPFTKEIKALKNRLQPKTPAERFDYRAVLHEKNTLLHTIFNAAEKIIIADCETGPLADWIQKNSWVKAYSVFKNQKRRHLHASWKQWKTMQFPSESDIEAAWNEPNLKREHLFYAWVQYHLHLQLKNAADYCAEKGLIVKGDIPILLNEDSADVWANPELFRADLCAGSPPDSDNPMGQNWGFPLYNWDTLKHTNYRWWKDRLTHAAQYYHAFRLDHILGFFRIWAIPKGEPSGLLGTMLPYAGISSEDLLQAGFTPERIQWMAEPHVPTSAIQSAVNGDYLYAHGLLHRLTDRIGAEELWRFKSEIRTETDIGSFELPEQVEAVFREKWRDRMLVKAGYEPDGTLLYTSCAVYQNTTAWNTLSEEEQSAFTALTKEKEALQYEQWKTQAEQILSELCAAVDMQPCAEDLGAIPPVLPPVLQKLNIYSLKVFRWERCWKEERMPFISLQDYPERAVAVTSVHDSSTFRGWWNGEAGEAEKNAFFTALNLSPEQLDAFKDLQEPCTEEQIQLLLTALVQSPCRLAIFPIQDWLALIHTSLDGITPEQERINIPGTVSSFNWTYRLPLSIEKMLAHKTLIKQIKAVTKAQKEHK